jgi:hypothetical protein
MAAAAISEYVQQYRKADLSPHSISEAVTATLRPQFQKYGLSEVSLRITDFAFIKAIRLVQDSRWSIHSDFLDTVKGQGA